MALPGTSSLNFDETWLTYSSFDISTHLKSFPLLTSSRIAAYLEFPVRQWICLIIGSTTLSSWSHLSFCAFWNIMFQGTNICITLRRIGMNGWRRGSKLCKITSRNLAHPKNRGIHGSLWTIISRLGTPLCILYIYIWINMGCEIASFYK